MIVLKVRRLGDDVAVLLPEEAEGVLALLEGSAPPERPDGLDGLAWDGGTITELGPEAPDWAAQLELADRIKSRAGAVKRLKAA